MQNSTLSEFLMTRISSVQFNYSSPSRAIFEIEYESSVPQSNIGLSLNNLFLTEATVKIDAEFIE